MTDQELLVELAEHLRHRFFGKYRGIVIDNQDPEGLLRLQATVPAVLGTTTSGWALPCVPYAGPSEGMFFLPSIGAGVWIEFEGGDVSYPVWTGCYWRTGEVPSDAAPKVRGVVTEAGEKLLFDDNAQSATLTDSFQNSLTLDATGLTQTRDGSSVAVGNASVSINDGAFEVM